MWTTRGRDWNVFKNYAFCAKLADLFPDPLSAFAHVASIGDVDTITAFCNSTVSSLQDNNAPPNDITYRERRSNEWFDDACQDAKTQARYLERRF